MKVLGVQTTVDGDASTCLPDAVWMIMRELGFNHVAIEDVRQGIPPVNFDGYRTIKGAQEYSISQGLRCEKLPYGSGDKPAIISHKTGCFLLQCKYWLLGDDLTKPAPVHQVHLAAFLADRRILLDNDSHCSPVIVDDTIPMTQEYAREVFAMLWNTTIKVEMTSAYFVGHRKQPFPDDVEQLFLTATRRAKNRKVIRMDNNGAAGDHKKKKKKRSGKKKKAKTRLLVITTKLGSDASCSDSGIHGDSAS
jgi:hypothetical protein